MFLRPNSIDGVRVWPAPENTRVVFDLKSKPEYEATSLYSRQSDWLSISKIPLMRFPFQMLQVKINVLKRYGHQKRKRKAQDALF